MTSYGCLTHLRRVNKEDAREGVIGATPWNFSIFIAPHSIARAKQCCEKLQDREPVDTLSGPMFYPRCDSCRRLLGRWGPQLSWRELTRSHLSTWIVDRSRCDVLTAEVRAGELMADLHGWLSLRGQLPRSGEILSYGG